MNVTVLNTLPREYEQGDSVWYVFAIWAECNSTAEAIDLQITQFVPDFFRFEEYHSTTYTSQRPDLDNNNPHVMQFTVSVFLCYANKHRQKPVKNSTNDSAWVAQKIWVIRLLACNYWIRSSVQVFFFTGYAIDAKLFVLLFESPILEPCVCVCVRLCAQTLFC